MLAAAIAASERDLRDGAPPEVDDAEEEAMLAAAIALSRQESYASSSGQGTAPPMHMSDSSAASGHERGQSSGLASELAATARSLLNRAASLTGTQKDPVVVVDDDDL